MADLEYEHKTFGPWDGANETSPGPGDVLRAVNVDFEDGMVRRRRGRAFLGTITGAHAIAGLHQHVGLNGERVILATLNYDHAAGRAFPTVFRLEGTTPAAGTQVDIPVSRGVITTEADPWGFVTFAGYTIMCAPGGGLLAFDGENVLAVDAMDGADRESGLVGARSYLRSPPRASSVAVWRNRLVAAAGRTVGLSATKGDLAIPTDARIGAPNVWPARNNFDVLTKQGDFVQSVAVIGDRLAVLTRGGAAVVDEDDLSPIVSIRDRKYGCIAPGSVQECAQELIYLADGMVVSFDGDSVKDISSEAVSFHLGLVDWTQARRAVSVHLARRNEYRIWLPTKGGEQNSLCLIYNYVRRKWRVYVAGPVYGWGYPGQEWQGYDVTAAAAVLVGDREVLITGSSDGKLWLEDAATNYDASEIPWAYVLLPAMGEGERVLHFGGNRIHALMDGAFVETWAMFDGIRFEEELDRALSAATMRASVVRQRALRDDHPTYEVGAAWNLERHVGDPGTLYFSNDRQKSTRLQIALVMPGSNRQVSPRIDLAPGGIQQIEIALRLGTRQGRATERGANAVHDGDGGAPPAVAPTSIEWTATVDRVPPDGSRFFNALVLGGDTSITWSVSGPGAGYITLTPSVGTDECEVYAAFGAPVPTSTTIRAASTVAPALYVEHTFLIDNI